MAIVPEIDEVSRPFWDAARDHRLVMQRCAQCKRWRFPPRPMCPNCQSLASEWEQVAGRGTIWSYIVCHRPLLSDYEPLAPFVVALIELEEYPELRMVGNILRDEAGSINEVQADELKVGKKVKVSFMDEGSGVVLPQWVLV